MKVLLKNKTLQKRFYPIVSAKIHPSIGISRVGNSDEDFYLAPETCYEKNVQLKDKAGKLKRQVQRFRVYGYDEKGNVVKELTNGGDTQIDWKVHVANKKSEWFNFEVAMDIPEAPEFVTRRNANIKDRSQLIIDGGVQTISGNSKSGPKFDSGSFMGEKVYLGELRTDEKGRLLFFGGKGVAKSPFENNTPTTFANNDGKRHKFNNRMA